MPTWARCRRNALGRVSPQPARSASPSHVTRKSDPRRSGCAARKHGPGHADGTCEAPIPTRASCRRRLRVVKTSAPGVCYATGHDSPPAPGLRDQGSCKIDPRRSWSVARTHGSPHADGTGESPTTTWACLRHCYAARQPATNPRNVTKAFAISTLTQRQRDKQIPFPVRGWPVGDPRSNAGQLPMIP